VERCGGNKRAASRALGISYHTLKAYLRSPFYESVGDENPTAPNDHGGVDGREDKDAVIGELPAEDPESVDGQSRV
jgi:hypothetical protein